MEERAQKYFKTIDDLWTSAEREVLTDAVNRRDKTNLKLFLDFYTIYHPNDESVRKRMLQSYTPFWRDNEESFPKLTKLERLLTHHAYYKDQLQQVTEHKERQSKELREQNPPIKQKAQEIEHTVLDTTTRPLLLGNHFKVLSTPLATPDSGKIEYTPVPSNVTLMATPLCIGTATHYESKGKGLTIKLVDLLKIYFPGVDASVVISSHMKPPVKDTSKSVPTDNPRSTRTSKRAKRVASNTDTRLFITSPNTEQYWLKCFKKNTPKMQQAYDAGWVLKINNTKVTLPTVLGAAYTTEDFTQACEETTEKKLCEQPAAWWYRVNSPLSINTVESSTVLKQWLVNCGKDTGAENQVYQLLTSLELLDVGAGNYRVAFQLPSLKLSTSEDGLSRELQQLIQWAHKSKKNIEDLVVELLWTYKWTDVPNKEKKGVTHNCTLPEGLGYSTTSKDGVVKGMRAYIHTDCSEHNGTWTVYFCGSPMYTIFFKGKDFGCALKWHTSCPDWVTTHTFSYYFGPIQDGTPAGSYPLSLLKGNWVDGEDGISGLQFANSPLTHNECAMEKDALKSLVEKKQYIGFTSKRGTKYLGRPPKTVRGKDLKIAYNWVAVSKNAANCTLPVQPSNIKETHYNAIAETPSFDDLTNPINWQIRKDVVTKKDELNGEPAAKKIRLTKKLVVRTPLKVDKTANCWVYDKKLKEVKAELEVSTQSGRSTILTCTLIPGAITGRTQRSRPGDPRTLVVVDRSKKPPSFIMRQTGIKGLRCLIHCINTYLETAPASYKIPGQLKGKQPEQVAKALTDRLKLQLQDASSIKQIATWYPLDKASNKKRMKQNLAQGMSLEDAKKQQSDVYKEMRELVTTELRYIRTHEPLSFTSQVALADLYGIQLVTHVVCTLDDELNKLPDDPEVSVAEIKNNDGKKVRVKIIKRMQTADAEFVCHLLNVEYNGKPDDSLTASTNCDHFNFLEACKASQEPLHTEKLDSEISPLQLRAKHDGDYVKPAFDVHPPTEKLDSGIPPPRWLTENDDEPTKGEGTYWDLALNAPPPPEEYEYGGAYEGDKPYTSHVAKEQNRKSKEERTDIWGYD